MKRTKNKNGSEKKSVKCKLFRSIQIEHTIDIMLGLLFRRFTSFLFFTFFLSSECVFACVSLSLSLVMHSTAFTFSPRAYIQCGGSLLCV